MKNSIELIKWNASPNPVELIQTYMLDALQT